MDETKHRDDDDLRDVLAEERSRGSRRKKLDTEEKNRAARLRADVLQAYRNNDEVGFKIALLAAGGSEQSPFSGSHEFVRQRR